MICEKNICTGCEACNCICPKSAIKMEEDEYGNIYLSGYNLQILKLLENNFDMSAYIDKILEKYKKDIDF